MDAALGDDDASYRDYVYRLQQGKLWAAAIAIEHGVLMLRTLVKVLVPDEPGWVRDARLQVAFDHHDVSQDEENKAEELAKEALNVARRDTKLKELLVSAMLLLLLFLPCGCCCCCFGCYC